MKSCGSDGWWGPAEVSKLPGIETGCRLGAVWDELLALSDVADPDCGPPKEGKDELEFEAGGLIAWAWIGEWGSLNGVTHLVGGPVLGEGVVEAQCPPPSP